MNYSKLLNKQTQYMAGKGQLPELTAETFERSFEISYTHNSTAIEGNTLTLIETKLVLEDGISIGGKELREIYEQVNHQRAYRYVKQCIEEGKPLTEVIVKNIHQLLMENIMPGGFYRDVNVYISGAQHTPPEPLEMYRQIKDFYLDLSWKADSLNPIELAAWTHAEFVRIHPFRDGNGRTSRLLMNYQLMASGFPAIDIAKENRLEYFNALEAYAVSDELVPFAEMIAELVEQRLDQYLQMIEQAQTENHGQKQSQDMMPGQTMGF